MIILWLVKGQNILNSEKITDVFFQDQDKGHLLTSILSMMKKER